MLIAHYLPYKVYTTLAAWRVIRIDRAVLNTFVIISFFNRCLNPFIYASQYEVMRRSWAPLVEFLRHRIMGKPRLPPAAAAARIEPMPASAPSNPVTPATQELPMPAT